MGGGGCLSGSSGTFEGGFFPLGVMKPLRVCVAVFFGDCCFVGHPRRASGFEAWGAAGPRRHERGLRGPPGSAARAAGPGIRGVRRWGLARCARGAVWALGEDAARGGWLSCHAGGRAVSVLHTSHVPRSPPCGMPASSRGSPQRWQPMRGSEGTIAIPPLGWPARRPAARRRASPLGGQQARSAPRGGPNSRLREGGWGGVRRGGPGGGRRRRRRGGS